MPAIILYLGEILGFMPTIPALRAMTVEVVDDSNDVLDDVTLDGGREMWTEARWQAFVPRLRNGRPFGRTPAGAACPAGQERNGSECVPVSRVPSRRVARRGARTDALGIYT